MEDPHPAHEARRPFDLRLHGHRRTGEARHQPSLPRDLRRRFACCSSASPTTSRKSRRAQTHRSDRARGASSTSNTRTGLARHYLIGIDGALFGERRTDAALAKAKSGTRKSWRSRRPSQRAPRRRQSIRSVRRLRAWPRRSRRHWRALLFGWRQFLGRPLELRRCRWFEMIFPILDLFRRDTRDGSSFRCARVQLLTLPILPAAPPRPTGKHSHFHGKRSTASRSLESRRVRLDAHRVPLEAPPRATVISPRGTVLSPCATVMSP